MGVDADMYLFPCGRGSPKAHDVPPMKELRKIRKQHRDSNRLKDKLTSSKLRNSLLEIDPKSNDVTAAEILISKHYPNRSLDEFEGHFRPIIEFDQERWDEYLRTNRDYWINGLYNGSLHVSFDDYLDSIAPPRLAPFSFKAAFQGFFDGTWASFLFVLFIGVLLLLFSPYEVSAWMPSSTELMNIAGYCAVFGLLMGVMYSVDGMTRKGEEYRRLRKDLLSDKKWSSWGKDCAEYALLIGGDLDIPSPLFDLLKPIMEIEYSVFGQVSSPRKYISSILAKEYELQRFDSGHCVEYAAKIAFSSLWSTAEEHIATCSHCNETALKTHLKAGELTLCSSCFRGWTKPFNEKYSEFDSDWEFRDMNSDLCLCSQNLEEFATQGMIEQYVHDGLLVKKERDWWDLKRSEEASARARAARRLAESMKQCLSCSESFPKEDSNNQQYCSKCVVKRNYCQGIRGDRNRKCSKLNYKHWHCTECDYISSSYVGNCGCDEG